MGSPSWPPRGHLSYCLPWDRETPSAAHNFAPTSTTSAPVVTGTLLSAPVTRPPPPVPQATPRSPPALSATLSGPDKQAGLTPTACASPAATTTWRRSPLPLRTPPWLGSPPPPRLT